MCSVFASTPGADASAPAEPLLLLEAIARPAHAPPTVASARRTSSSADAGMATRVMARAAHLLNATVAVYAGDGQLIVQNRLSEALFGPAHTLADWWPQPASAVAALDTVRQAGFRGELVVPTRAGNAAHWVEVTPCADTDGPSTTNSASSLGPAGPYDAATVVMQIPLESIDVIRVLRVAKVGVEGADTGGRAGVGQKRIGDAKVAAFTVSAEPVFFVALFFFVQFFFLQEQALAANNAKSRFLATVSHEIRTPLHGLLGFAELLRETLLSAEQVRGRFLQRPKRASVAYPPLPRTPPHTQHTHPLSST